MKFASIVDPRYNPAEFSDYHLILSHVLIKDKFYRDYYVALDGGHTVVLDNGTVENGDPQPELLLDMAKYASGTNARLIVVAPDHLNNCEGTLKATGEFFQSLRDNLGYEIMVVPQGKDSEEWIRCLRLLREMGNFEFVGIPRVCEEFLGGRQLLYQAAKNLGFTGLFHLLGIQHNLSEIDWAIDKWDVAGVDSSLPIRAASIGMPAKDIRDLRLVPDREDYLEEWEPTVKQNIKECCEYVSGRP